jgi:hypothetical protein
MKRHVTCFVEKAGFEFRTLGTKAERYDHCATRPVGGPVDNFARRWPAGAGAMKRFGVDFKLRK